MKYFCTILLFTFSLNCFSQKNQTSLKDLKEKYRLKLSREVNKYNNKDFFLQDSILNKRVSKYLKSVIFGSSETNTNASSFGFTLNEEKTEITGNILIPLGNDKGKFQDFFKVGVFSKGKSNLFNLYSRNSWNNDIGLNLSYVFKFSGGLNFKQSISKKKKIDMERVYFLDSIVKNIDKLSFKDTLVLQKLRYINEKIKKDNRAKFKEKIAILSEDKKNNYNDLDKKTLLQLNNFIKKKGYKKLRDSLIMVKKRIKPFLLNKNIDSLVNAELGSFDDKNVVDSGYFLQWIDLNFQLSNSTYNIKKENILPKEIKKFDSELKIKGGVTYNFVNNKKNSYFYLQGGTSIVSGNFLDNNLVLDSVYVKKQDDKYLILDSKERIFGNYINLNRKKIYSSTNLYLAYFPIAKKKIGFSLNLESNTLLGRNNRNEYYKDNFTGLFGIMFRNIKEDDVNKGVFGIEFGYENTEYNYEDKYFVARLKIGVPLNLMF